LPENSDIYELPYSIKDVSVIFIAHTPIVYSTIT